jgi:hypothetical protein
VKKIEKPFGGFRVSMLMWDNILRMQTRPKDTGFAEKQRSRPLILGSLPSSGRSTSSGGSYSCH